MNHYTLTHEMSTNVTNIYSDLLMEAWFLGNEIQPDLILQQIVRTKLKVKLKQKLKQEMHENKQ